MEKLLNMLKTIPEYAQLLSTLRKDHTVAVTGIGQINRSHLIAGLACDCNMPLVILCQDDMAARRLQEELKAFLDETVPILPSRELTLYDTAVVSRAWEQKRLLVWILIPKQRILPGRMPASTALARRNLRP